ncbi:MAG: TIGR03905 family TSCPD domain-containing protein [Candidatus Borkfalkiaceae bacterium]|nr:TIGR03905 family TSCPD domain-containing protein [Clostridia bacterium]MDY6223324.1 TIGR03905 family TSCPD domain-containing protein [Christensenellaceae bacterium]
MFTYSTKGTCSRQILFDVTPDNKLHNVRFIGGCSGNLQGVARLVEGRDINEVETLLAGIRCRNNTSCPDQLSKAIAEYKASKTTSANDEDKDFL